MKLKIILILICLWFSGCMHINGISNPTSTVECPNNFPIKGNSDVYIYHSYDSPHYAKAKPDVCFKDAQRAEYYGYSKYKFWNRYTN